MAVWVSGSRHLLYIVVRSNAFTSRVIPSGSRFSVMSAAWSE